MNRHRVEHERSVITDDKRAAELFAVALTASRAETARHLRLSYDGISTDGLGLRSDSRHAET